jgi:oligoribonuclease (3'-5' exoribonuclease)
MALDSLENIFLYRILHLSQIHNLAKSNRNCFPKVPHAVKHSVNHSLKILEKWKRNCRRPSILRKKKRQH